MPPNWFLTNTKPLRQLSAHRAESVRRRIRGARAVDRASGRAAEHAGERALAEAAFMTGLERNADIVELSSYAPLFAHVDAWQWTPNLIWFDNLRSFGTPNYYVQKMFGSNRGTTILPVLLEGSTRNGQGDLFAAASLDDRSGEVILKVVNPTAIAARGPYQSRGSEADRKERQGFRAGQFRP